MPLTSQARDLGNPDDEDPLERAERVLSGDQLAMVRQRVLERAIERCKAERDNPDEEIQADCAICQDSAAEDISITGACGHIFCKAGPSADPRSPLTPADLDAWLDKEAAAPSCPTCRANITAESCFTIATFEGKEFDLDLARAMGASEDQLEEIERESEAKHNADPESAAGLQLKTPLTLPSRKVRRVSSTA